MNEDIKDLLVLVFEGGLDEDTHFRHIYDYLEDTSIEGLQAALQELNKDSFEYNLLSRLVEDMRWKLEAENSTKKAEIKNEIKNCYSK